MFDSWRYLTGSTRAHIRTHLVVENRRLDLELAEDAKLWSTVARYTSGPAARSFERRARQLEQVVTALRGAKR